MAIKKPIPITFNLDSRQSVQSVCAVIHIDDKNTETLDLSLMQGGEHIAVSPNSTVTARFVRVKDKILISDNVPCAVQGNGNLYIPIDNAAAHMLVGEIKIEVNIVDENDILTMQFPLVIKVNNTILADAEISPESEGTIPELLEEAREAAESATQAAKAATEAISTKQDKLTAGENITIEGNVISAEGADVSGKADKSYVDTELAKKADKTEIPTKISAFTNDVGYLTQHQDISGKADKSTTLAGYGITDAYTKTEVDNALSSKADSSAIPTKTSQLNNDSGFLTSHQDVSGKENTSNKKTSISNQSQTGDKDTNYPTVGAVRDFVNLVKNDLEDYVDDEIGNIYTKAEVDAAIQTAIGGVENGSY